MFNGIIENRATISQIQVLDADNWLMTVAVDMLNNEAIKLGDSLAMNGVCLTVEKITPHSNSNSNSNGKWSISFTLASETLKVTNFKTKKVGDTLNFEKAMQMSAQINGHFITGHVDALGKIKKYAQKGESHWFQISYPAALAPFIAKKGSIAIDGVSLTVNEVLDDQAMQNHAFEITIIPFTYQNTTFSNYKIGDLVNLEIDLLSRYIHRQSQFHSA